MGEKTLDQNGRLLIPKEIREEVPFLSARLKMEEDPFRRSIVITTTEEENAFSLDEQGRMLVPKAVREAMSWTGETPLMIVPGEHRLYIVEAHESCIICGRKDGLFPVEQTWLCLTCQKRAHQSVTEAWKDELHRLYDAYAGHVDKALQAEDLEEVHQARTTGRRIRAVLKFLGMKNSHPLLKTLKEAHTELGRVREADVRTALLEEREGEAWEKAAVFSREQLYSRIPGMQEELSQLVNETFHQALSRWIEEELPEARHRVDEQEKLEEEEAVLDQYVRQFDKDGDWDALHDVRKQSKKLRYMYQFMGNVYGGSWKEQGKQYKRWQRSIGVINDLNELHQFLKSRGKKSPLSKKERKALQQEIKKERREALKQADLPDA
ncbi:CHAD domain-containing protein [Alkalicoccus urumqiensis]|uniref:CHAD domain-containing protein n=1 Tax=Alkalicoccus urumqiensis TaxID=1548213 RepID=A0A2P6MH05_ALKUR|nr:CHAD domain-containing protein [Alkalicoccus urumqiensis]PRO65557.1 hypothetical protein C6I21_08495 [Alkalicoccus urumqiensis]